MSSDQQENREKLKGLILRKKLINKVKNAYESVRRGGKRVKTTSKNKKAARQMDSVEYQFYKGGLNRFETYDEFLAYALQNARVLP